MYEALVWYVNALKYINSETSEGILKDSISSDLNVN